MLQVVRQPTISRREQQKSVSLAEAADQVFAIAKRDNLPLAYIAERDNPERPQYWFANNMLHIIPVYGRRTNESEYERIAQKSLSDLKLREDMTVLESADTRGIAYVDLIVSRSDFESYVRWVRSVY